MRSLLVVMVALGCWLDSRPAEACSCAAETRILHPDNGATGLPLNAAVMLAMTDDAEPVVLEHESTGARLTLDVRRMTKSTTGSSVLATSPVELQPNAHYNIIVNGVGFGYFVTGDQRDDAAPATAGLTGMTPETMAWPNGGCSGSCTTVDDELLSRFRFSYTRPDDVVFAAVEIYRQHATDKIRTRLFDLIGGEVCGERVPAIDPDATYCARAVVYDAGGNETVGDELCTAPEQCATKRDPSSTCEPSRECAATGGGCSTTTGSGWLVVALFAISRGWSRRSARRRPLRARPSSP